MASVRPTSLTEADDLWDRMDWVSKLAWLLCCWLFWLVWWEVERSMEETRGWLPDAKLAVTLGRAEETGAE